MYYVVATKQTSKKTIRQVFECDNLISFTHMAQAIKNSPERFSDIALSEQAPRTIKRTDYVTIYNTVKLNQN